MCLSRHYVLDQEGLFSCSWLQPLENFMCRGERSHPPSKQGNHRCAYLAVVTSRRHCLQHIPLAATSFAMRYDVGSCGLNTTWLAGRGMAALLNCATPNDNLFKWSSRLVHVRIVSYVHIAYA